MHRDNSESALNDKEFARNALQSCDQVRKMALPGDEFVGFLVDGNIPIAKDPNPTTLQEIRAFCSLKTQLISNKPGTYICPTITLTRNVIQRSDLPPVVLSIVQTNVGEQFCGEIWRALANDIEDKNGTLIILNSTNKVGQNYNHNLATIFQNYSNVKFCDNKRCVKYQINSVRNNKT